MYRVLVIGAGSIGNHLAHACRQKNWQVTVFDIDTEALARMEMNIYPARYGRWDDDIKLTSTLPSGESFDLVIIGTPPDHHINVALDVIQSVKMDVLVIEKPLCPSDMADVSELFDLINREEVTALIGYNHNLCENTRYAEKLIEDGLIGEPFSMHVRWLEYWGGIFNAHPWLDGPHDSYLGYIERGGGACHEHSHAISIWGHFSHYLGQGKIHEIYATMQYYSDGKIGYDQSSLLNVKSENGLVGSIILDVVTEPAQKNLRIQGSEGFIEWYINYDVDNDAVVHAKTGEQPTTKLIPKKRPDDFKAEIDHIENLLVDSSIKSSISWERGIDCMNVISSAIKSNETGTNQILN